MSVIKDFAGTVVLATGALFAMAKFVELINPGVAQLFFQSLKDLSATIGTALVPVLGIFTGVINEISGMLLPIMQELAPIFQDIANELANNLMVVLRVVFDIFAALIPVIRVVVDAWQQWVQVARLAIDVLINLVRAIAGVVKDAIGGVDWNDIRDTIKKFGEALKELVVQLTLVGAALLIFLGLNNIVGKFAENIQKQIAADAARPRGARSMDQLTASITDIKGQANAIALAAAVAMAGPAQRKDDAVDWLKKIAEGLRPIMEGRQTLEETIANAINKSKLIPTKEDVGRVGGGFGAGFMGGAVPPVAQIAPWVIRQMR